ncbi:peroxisomal nicotinamide adenine dinucleotide carrier-like isoform X2 [Varroa destructor]|uniref:Peptidase C1A papain C-terminal domain-containing protein n=2 Tax=Varroa TaxID=62624 RepID=A0A7M7KG30_VARDE|nr:peroxisomal nicotinamide adenine dinucleotide carrier-like isoform X2 [Varroa destructor]
MALSKVLAERLFTHETLVHAISGAAGATVAMSLFYPLDTIRSRLQVEEGRESKSIVEMLRDIMESEGFEGIYRGLSPVLQSLWCSNFVYFYSFHGLRAVFSTDRGHSAGRDLMLATIAGVINVIVTTPMWVVNTRMKMQGAIAQYGPHDQENQSANYKFRSLLDGLITIYREEGVHALWSSTLPSLILVSNPSIQFMVYEALKRRCETLGIALSAGTAFSLGAISKCIATVLTYPLQVVDYRDTHFSTPIKEQRECGACWAFAPTEVMEAMRFGFRSAKVEKIAKSLSVQHLIDCSGVSYGCKGGDVCDAMDYLIATDYQFVLEADYLPYSAVKHSTCQRQVTPSANITIGQSTCEDFSKSEDSLLSFIAYHGPVVASVDATVWKDYLGGIIRYNCDAGPKNHAVVIAGYNLTHSPPYYIVRNSWGRSFGDNGYMYIATGRNLCGIADKITLLYPKYN